MDPITRKRIQVERQRGNQRLAFTGAHFGNFALVQDQSADQLHIEMTLANGSLGSLPHRGKSFWEEFIQYFLLDLAVFLFIIDAFQLPDNSLPELVRF